MPEVWLSGLKFDSVDDSQLSVGSIHCRVSPEEPTVWWTSEGERVLQGAEWDLFREGLSSLWDDVEAAEEEDGPGTTGIARFRRTPEG